MGLHALIGISSSEQQTISQQPAQLSIFPRSANECSGNSEGTNRIAAQAHISCIAAIYIVCVDKLMLLASLVLFEIQQAFNQSKHLLHLTILHLKTCEDHHFVNREP